MSTNPLAELPKLGQSVWYDQMQRSLVTEGHLQRMITEDDLRGLTSNPTIFEKAIGGTREYDAALEQYSAEGKSVDEIYEAIVVDDIGMACDVFRSVYEKTGSMDGFCSLEVSPQLARDTRATVAEGLKLFRLLGRDNVMIKVPATPEGIPAIEELIYEGVNVNVTLIFSREVYAKVIDAYMRGLERRVAENKPVGWIASVASFFVSRIDSKVDAQIDARLAGTADEVERRRLESLKGKIAIANAKAAYRLFREQFASDRFLKLRDAGAMVQRPLWASTGTKNPSYSDVLYVESLIGADTVNTIPPATYDAFRDHGRVQPAIETRVEEAMTQLAMLEELGISLDRITDELTSEGVKSFADSFESLMRTITVARAVALRSHRISSREHPGAHKGDIDRVLETAHREKWVQKIWSRDASLWKGDAESQTLIGNSLGWLGVPRQMLERLDEVLEFAEQARSRFDHVVVLGMGGSSLCSEVTRTIVGRREGWPALHVLDSTVPESIRSLENRIDLGKTLFIVASKSGATTEPSMFMKYFLDRVRSIRGERAGEQFVAVTDPGTKLAQEAQQEGFSRTFVNWPDIGGRYSALSMFGIVPAALSGADVRTILERAVLASDAALPVSAETRNPGLRLGAFMGAMALKGMDKLTLLLPHPIEAFGLWVEQLVAESTGKEGRGILPVAGEPLQRADDYSSDRAFVALRMPGHSDEDVERLTRDLAASGRPVYEITFKSPEDLGDLFFTFELATAVAGRVLDVNPFDQPNVQESKSNTASAIERVRAGTTPFHGEVPLSSGDPRTEQRLRTLLQIPRGGYLAILAYIDDNEGHRELLRNLRQNVLSADGAATTAGFGPRYLHSTGQLHKGGGDGGRYLVLTADPVEDVAIPGETFGFAALAHAQAAGDIASLRARDREVLHVHLQADTYDELRRLTGMSMASGSVDA